ncbi:MAG: AMP-binding enzyme, partial [Bacteroidota bacterium]
RLCDAQDNLVAPESPGESQVTGDNVFHHYWNRPEATANSFTGDGWFRTGDVAIVEDGYYRILGRNSVDIIKSGGYKISALEIEEVLRSHPAIVDCCVVGLPDEEWGETVAAAIIVKEPLEATAIKSWLRERMPAYRTPRTFLMTDTLPRNAMGKVMKPEVKKLFNQP